MPHNLPAADLLVLRLDIGRDNARPLGWYAEHLRLTRREVEQAVQTLRLDGWPIASGPDGIWLGDWRDLDDTYRQLRSRIVAQSRTAWAVRSTRNRLRVGEIHQEELFPAA